MTVPMQTLHLDNSVGILLPIRYCIFCQYFARTLGLRPPKIIVIHSKEYKENNKPENYDGFGQTLVQKQVFTIQD